jgi:DDE superfamily endonuclease
LRATSDSLSRKAIPPSRMGSRKRQVCYDIYFLELYLYKNYRPLNKEELFNLRHASARNVIERIFGVLKHRFRILLLAPEYSLEIQARIPAALCAIHNFIRTYETGEELMAPDLNDDIPNDHDHVASAAVAADLDVPSARRDLIAQQMWDDYIRICNERGLGGEDLSGDEGEDEDGEDYDDEDSEYEDDD